MQAGSLQSAEFVVCHQPFDCVIKFFVITFRVNIRSLWFSSKLGHKNCLSVQELVSATDLYPYNAVS